MKKKKTFLRLNIVLRLLAILLVVAIAAGLRWHAVVKLPVDYDEDDYIRAAQQFTALIRAGDWKGFLDTNYRPEHPPLEKIAFGVSLLSAPDESLTPDHPTSAEPDIYLPAICCAPPGRSRRPSGPWKCCCWPWSARWLPSSWGSTPTM